MASWYLIIVISIIIIIICCCFHFWSTGHPWNFVSLQFLNLGQSVGLLRGVISPSQGLYHTGQHKHWKTQKHINFHASSRIRIYGHGIRAKTVHALDRPATVTGSWYLSSSLKSVVLSGGSVSSRFPTCLVFRYNAVISEINVLMATLGFDASLYSYILGSEYRLHVFSVSL
jgi:hypothetical protein